MFNWIRTKVQDKQIAMSFPAYEAAAREAHDATARRQFSTQDINREIIRLMTIPHQEMQVRYLEPIAKLSSTLTMLSAEFAIYREKINILERSYKSELDPLYAEMSELRDCVKTLLAQKSEAHDDMSQARDDIDSWHAQSSGTFFGNGGKALPNHSLFGQSFGDLDGYKSDREAAYNEIERCGNEIGAVKSRMDQLRSTIAGIKADRQRMVDLRKQGVQSADLKRIACFIAKRIGQVESERRQMDDQRAIFLEAARQRTGVVVLESTLTAIIAKRNDFIATFDQTYAITDRKLIHRSTWLRDHAA